MNPCHLFVRGLVVWAGGRDDAVARGITGREVGEAVEGTRCVVYVACAGMQVWRAWKCVCVCA